MGLLILIGVIVVITITILVIPEGILVPKNRQITVTSTRLVGTVQTTVETNFDKSLLDVGIDDL